MSDPRITADGAERMPEEEKLSPEELKEVTGGGEFSDVPTVDENPYTQKDRDNL